MNGFWRRLFGTAGERAAEKYLQQQGFKIIARQFNTRWGEIDLIATEGETIVFIEVKTRRSDASGNPTERIDQTKREHSTKAALVFLKRHRLLGRRSRFDVVSVVWPTDDQEPRVEHIRNAFEAVDFGQMY